MQAMTSTGEQNPKGMEGSRERGATVFEFALILPMFLLLVFGIIEFGHAWYIYHTAVNASREGARYAIVYRNKPGVTPAQRWLPQDWSGSQPSVEARVKEYLKQFFDEDFVEKKVIVPPLSGTPNNVPPNSLPDTENEDLVVTVIIPKRWLVLGPLIGLQDLSIGAATTMKLE